MSIFKRNRQEGNIQPKELYNRPARWPSGTAIKTPSGVWFIKNNKRFKCFSERTTWSWGFRPVEAAEESLSKIPKGGVLGFRDGTLIKDIFDGRIYLVSDSKIRHVTNPDVLGIFGEPLLVSHDEAQIHTEGEPLNGI